MAFVTVAGGFSRLAGPWCANNPGANPDAGRLKALATPDKACRRRLNQSRETLRRTLAP